jgi:hypothetical protein
MMNLKDGIVDDIADFPITFSSNDINSDVKCDYECTPLTYKVQNYHLRLNRESILMYQKKKKRKCIVRYRVLTFYMDIDFCPMILYFLLLFLLEILILLDYE